MNTGKLKRKRRQPDARTIKKHSDIVRERGVNMLVGGVRSKTPTGYIVVGFTGKSFETYFEYMLSNSSSPLLMHEKKDRTVRVLSGLLYVLTGEGDEVSQTKAIAGDEVVLERGTAYRLGTSAEPTQLLVCQNTKYAGTLQVLDESTAVIREVPEHLLVTPTMDERYKESRPHDLPSGRKGSKAKEQLVAMRVGRKQSVQVSVAEVLNTAATVETKNPRPSQGRFSDEGAG